MIDAMRPEPHRMRQIRKLTQVTHALTNAVSLADVFQMTVDHASDLLAADVSLLMVTGDDGLLAPCSWCGLDRGVVTELRAPLDEELMTRLADLLDAPVGRFVCVPLVVAGAIKGVLVVIRATGSIPSDEDEWLLSALADQAALALERTRLDQVAEFREQLIAIVGHDLRNPLAAILGAAHVLLERETLGAKETALARRITSSASRAMRLIEQLLDLTRSRLGGGIPIDPTAMDLNDVLQQVVGETDLVHPERALHADLRGDLTGVWDRDRLYQLLTNLVGNAVIHGEARSPIEVRVRGEDTEILIEVANRGTPIPTETLPHIFDAFRQGRAAHGTRSNGLGLGLFIVKEIARAHGGSIAATSSDDDGTRFRVHLPRAAVGASSS